MPAVSRPARLQDGGRGHPPPPARTLRGNPPGNASPCCRARPKKSSTGTGQAGKLKCCNAPRYPSALSLRPRARSTG